MTRRRSGWRGLRIGLAVLLCARASVAAAATPATPELDAERDVLIDKIARGVEVEASVKRFAAIIEERDRKVATSKAARDKLQAEQSERRAFAETYRKTADYEVSWRCTLSVDPAHPTPSDERRWPVDWGKVTKKESVRLPPKNDLDEGELVTLYEIAGQARTYRIVASTAPTRRETPLQADRGDLVLVCDAGTEHKSRLPAPYADLPVDRPGYAARIAAPPAIVSKGKWRPRHITGSRFYWAVRDVKWKYPPEEFVLANIEIGEDLGQGRYRIDSQNVDWVMEVPPGIKNRHLLVRGRPVWAILGQARFDKALRKLVLVAEDLEERYVIQK